MRVGVLLHLAVDLTNVVARSVPWSQSEGTLELDLNNLALVAPRESGATSTHVGFVQVCLSD